MSQLIKGIHYQYVSFACLDKKNYHSFRLYNSKQNDQQKNKELFNKNNSYLIQKHEKRRLVIQFV